jgi:2-polyprenyl-3-methyl-5-hydroxy-6-metoxy-1,4-benzoquinol methylase
MSSRGKFSVGSVSERLRGAELDLLEEFAWNDWFTGTYWPENSHRIRLMMRLIMERCEKGGRVLEVGCANGYVAYLVSLLGYEVHAVDAYDDGRRAQMFEKGAVRYWKTNLNEVEPLAKDPTNSYDLVLLGEVFEHILNQPAGLLRSSLRILRPGGMIILTTPNPSTFMNAVRVLGDNYVLWGTDSFMRDTKINGDLIIDKGDIHYREYPARLVADLMHELGFQIGGIKYVQSGVASTHSLLKRFFKGLVMLTPLAHSRLFSPGYVIWAQKPTDGPKE